MSRGVLRIAFAMGGGVSLGTFSASALIETLRFLRISLHSDFTGFEIDAISGASAGSLTLALMLHGLLYANSDANEELQKQKANPTDEYVHGLVCVKSKRFVDEENAHGDRLFQCYLARKKAGEYGAGLAALVEDLWRLAELEKTMDDVWNRLLNVENLLNPKGKDNQAFHCLFNFRGAVEDAGRMFLQEKPFCSASPMLASRVLMGFTLTNLNALPGRYAHSLSAGELSDGEDAAENREVRIFDIRVGATLSVESAVNEYAKCPHFLLVQDPKAPAAKSKLEDEEKKTFSSLSFPRSSLPSSSPSSSYAFQSVFPLRSEIEKRHAEHIAKDKTKGQAGKVFSSAHSSLDSLSSNIWQGQNLYLLRSLETWSMITATATASAAFPAAFEPVSLTRYRHELPNSELMDRWPIAHPEMVEYPFSYVDGGVLNNEPVQEAYRLAALIDSHNGPTSGKFERVVLSIDPNISSPSYDFPLPHAPVLNLPIHSVSGRYPNLQGVLSTVSALVGSIASTLSREEDKVRETIRIFQLRDQFLQKISTVLSFDGILPDDAPGTLNSLQTLPLKDLKSALEVELKRQTRDSMIPDGDPNLYHALVHIARDLHHEQLDEQMFKRFFDGPHDIPWEKSVVFKCLKCVLYLMVDLVLQLSAKNRTAHFIGIAPMWHGDELVAAYAAVTSPASASLCALSSPVSHAKRPLDLPAMKLNGFVGFISETANAISKLAGKRLSTLHLSRLKKNIKERLGFQLLEDRPEVDALDTPIVELLRLMRSCKDDIVKELSAKLELGTGILIEDVLKFAIPNGGGSWWWPQNWKTSLGTVEVRRILRPSIMRALIAAVHERYEFELWIHLPQSDSDLYFNSKKNPLQILQSVADADKVFVPQDKADKQQSKYLVFPLLWDVDEHRWVGPADESDASYIEVTDQPSTTANGAVQPSAANSTASTSAVTPCQQYVKLFRKVSANWFQKDPLVIHLPIPHPEGVNVRDVLLRPAPRIFGSVSPAMKQTNTWNIEWTADLSCKKTVLTMEKSLLRLATANNSTSTTSVRVQPTVNAKESADIGNSQVQLQVEAPQY